MSRAEQDRIFKRNALIRQKIGGIVLCLVTIGSWAWLMSYDCVNVWYLPLVLLFVFTGIGIIAAKETILEKGE